MKHLTIKAPSLSFEEEMGVMLNRVNMEAEFLEGFASTVSSLVPNMMAKTKDFMSNFLATDGNIKEVEELHALPGDLTSFLHLMERQDYMGIAPMAINVPEGFSGDLVTYTALLLTSAEHAVGLVEKVINPYNAFLSGLLSNPSAQKRAMDELGFMDKIQAERNRLVQGTSQHFKHGSNQARLEIGKAVRRNADWRQTLLNARKATEEIKKLSNKDAQKAINDCVSLLNAVKTTAESKDLSGISPEMLRTLATRTLMVAKEAEFFAITSFRITVLNTVMDYNIKDLSSKLKK